MSFVTAFFELLNARCISSLREIRGELTHGHVATLLLRLMVHASCLMSHVSPCRGIPHPPFPRRNRTGKIIDMPRLKPEEIF